MPAAKPSPRLFSLKRWESGGKRDTAALPSRAVPRLHHSTKGPGKAPQGGALCPANTGTPGAHHSCSLRRLTQHGQDQDQGAVLGHSSGRPAPLLGLQLAPDVPVPACCQRRRDLGRSRQHPGEAEAGHPAAPGGFQQPPASRALPLPRSRASQLKDPRALAKGAPQSHWGGSKGWEGAPNLSPPLPGALRGSLWQPWALQAKPHQPQPPARGGGELGGLRRALTREREDLGANLELVFPKPFQTLRLLAGSAAAPASLSSYTMSFHWQGQRRGKNNPEKQGTCDGELG